MKRAKYTFFIFILFGLLAAPTVAASVEEAALDDVRQELHHHVDQIESGAELQIGETAVVATLVIPPFYAQRSFRPAWTDSSLVDTLVDAIRGSYDDGLTPSDYHLDEIERLRAAVATAPSRPDLVADLDVLLTDALLMLAYHHLYGKVDPESVNSNWNIERDLLGGGPVEGIEHALTERTLADDLQRIQPKHDFYLRLRTALKAYREIEARGGWANVPTGKALRAGDDDPRVSALRRRLRVTGDLATEAGSESTEFDDDVEEAVKQFQARHGLNADGVAGKNTVAEMNVPVGKRIDQIRINMERARWYPRELEREAVFANIAGFNVYFVRDGRMVWSSRSMVGKQYRKTPLFKGEMAYVQFNPTWTVPPGILRKDILPKVKKDPGYLAAKNISVLDRQGNKVDPASIDWPSLSSRNFPYVLRQEPGPTNALGRVKFIFPNKHFVFLHDTPHRGGFAKETRTFSSGCIRVEKPFELAGLVLDDPKNWSPDKIREVVDSEKIRTVYLNEPMAVYLAYWTAAVGDSGSVNFRRDVYDRDSAVLAGLEAEFSMAGRVKRKFQEQLGR